jgi:hypothetical protein
MFVGLVLLVSTPAVHGQYIGDFVAIANAEGSEYRALTDAGWLFQYRIVEDQWEGIGSIPVMAGHPTSGHFVDISNRDSSGGSPCALTDEGEFYWVHQDQWQYVGNVQDLAGHPSDGSFVSLELSNHLGVLTSNGDSYEKRGDDWVFLGNILEHTGIIPAQSESWGSLKRQFKGGDK